MPIETTEVIRGIENIVKNQVEGLSFTKIQNDACVDHTFPASLLSSNMLWDKCLELRNRGVKIRTITEVTPKNIAYCKRMVERMELRHLDAIKGNFSISDRKTYRGSATMHEGEPPTEGIRSTTKVFVDQQQYFFETLWNKAVPAKQRFKEIEQAAKREFIETVRDPYEIQKIGFDLIKKAEEEILILFSTANAFSSQEKAGVLELIKEAVSRRGIKVRILIPIGDNDDDNNKGISERIQQMKDARIDIRTIKQAFRNKLTTLVIDQASCLTVELKEDTKEETSDDSLGLATYSNSEATVFSYASIFENLWIQTELHKRK